MKMVIKKQRGISNWIISISCLCFFVLVSCSESIDEQPSPSGKSQTAINQEIKKFNEVVQTATAQFTKELNKALVQATTEFRNQTEEILKKVEDQKKVQVKLDQEALTSELNTIIQRAMARFTEGINKSLEQATTQFRSQMEEILKKGRGDAEDIKGELDAAVQAAITQFSTEMNKVAMAAKNDIADGTAGAATKARDDITGGIGEASTAARDNVTGGIGEAATVAKGDLTGGIGEASTAARENVAEGIGEASTAARENVTGGIGEASTAARDNVVGGIGEAATVAKDNVTKGIGDAATTARNNVVGGIGEAATAAKDDITGGIGDAATVARATLAGELDKVMKDATDRFRREAANIIQDARTQAGQTSESSCPLTKSINIAKPIVRDAVRNLELIVDRELTIEIPDMYGNMQKGFIERVFDDREIQWEAIVTEQDKAELADQIVSALYNDEKYKYERLGITGALASSIKDTTVPAEEITMLTRGERLTLGCRINVEIRKDVKQLMEERIRYLVDKTIDIETATEAVYTLQFDIASSLPHIFSGKPVALFISMEKAKKPEEGTSSGEGEGSEEITPAEEEDSKNFILSRKGDCVRIKKEDLSSIKITLLYTNPALEGNLPNTGNELCNQTDEHKCSVGNYNIQQVGEREGINYVLKWARPKGSNSSHCPEFPSN